MTSQTREDPAGAAMRVLLIERSADGAAALAAGLAECFAQAPQVETATSGRGGTELLRQRDRDLVLADIAALTDLAGAAEDAVARLTRLAGAALTIILSEDGSVSAAVAAMRAGAHDYVAKPVASAAFAARIAALALRHGKTLDLRPSVRAALGYGPLSLAASNDVRPFDGPAVVGAPQRRAVLPMWQQEQRIIEDAIASFSGNVALAAAALELSPSTIYRKRAAWAQSEAGSKGAA